MASEAVLRNIDFYISFSTSWKSRRPSVCGIFLLHHDEVHKTRLFWYTLTGLIHMIQKKNPVQERGNALLWVRKISAIEKKRIRF